MKALSAREGRNGRELRLTETALLTFCALVLELLQNRLLPTFLHLQFLFIVVLYVGWYAPPVRGGLIGTLLGIAQDYITGLYLGINGLSKCLLGFGAHYLSGWLAADIGLFRVVLFALLAGIDRLLVYFLLEMVGPARLVEWEAGLTALLTGIAAEIFFRLYDKIRFPPRDFSQW